MHKMQISITQKLKKNGLKKGSGHGESILKYMNDLPKCARTLEQRNYSAVTLQLGPGYVLNLEPPFQS